MPSLLLQRGACFVEGWLEANRAVLGGGGSSRSLILDGKCPREGSRRTTEPEAAALGLLSSFPAAVGG